MTDCPTPPARPRAWRTLPVAIATSVTALCATVPAASAAGLFEPLTAQESEAFADVAVSPYATRSRLVRIDRDYAEANLAPHGIDRARDRITRAPVATTLELELFPGHGLTLERDSLTRAGLGGYVWDGRVHGHDGYALLVAAKGTVSGQVQAGTRLFDIAPVSGGIHRISEIDPGRFPPPGAIPAPEVAGPAPRSLPVPEGRSIIRVIVPYTKAARKASGNIKQDARRAIALANKATKNAGVAIRYKLVGTMEVRGYKEKSFEKDLINASKGKKLFKPVHKMRNRKRADLVAVLRKTDPDQCGFGWSVETPSRKTAPYGYNVSAHTCIPDQVIAHEMGHNSGLEHDRFQIEQETGKTPPKSQYHFGYSNLEAKVISVMAYQGECYVNGLTCVRAPMFSTPDKTFKGHTMGIAKGQAGAADAARRLDETRATIAAYR